MGCIGTARVQLMAERITLRRPAIIFLSRVWNQI